MKIRGAKELPTCGGHDVENTLPIYSGKKKTSASEKKH